ncbi:MAG: hypothetical protein HZB61_02775 [Nitrospirae bacterium]|nr:hypothetical protein [Nitrospirota bacterium]
MAPSFHEREHWTLFRTLQGLKQVIGVDIHLLPKLVAKELTDNALDASSHCETGLLEGNGFFVEDYGKGISGTDEEIASLFSINRPLRSTKYYRMPTRGAVGNGSRVIAASVLVSEGTLKVMTRGRCLQLFPQFDAGETLYRQTGNYNKTGTRIEVTLPNFNLNNVFEWSNKAIQLNRGNRYKGKTSPHWYDFDFFYELVKSSPDDLTVARFVEEFDSLSGDIKWKIAEEFNVKKVKKLNRVDIERLQLRMRKLAKPVSTERLGLVGDIEGFDVYHKTHGNFEIRLEEQMSQPIVPYVLEVWVKNSDKFRSTFCVNRTPVTGNVNTHVYPQDVWLFGCGIDCRANVKTPKEILVNVITPYMPITSDSKAPDFSALNDKIGAAITAAIKKSKSKQSNPKQKKISQKQVVLDNLDVAMIKSSDNYLYRYSQRQIYYVARAIVNRELGKDLTYKNFIKIITGHEAEKGSELRNIYRDDRGVLYHPHLKETITLGTLSVENYKTPEWTFNKIIYCEKEGFIEILKSAKWPEKHDCALLTSKGYSTGAARDVLDLIGESDEELLFFCIHDADIDGTLIYQSLVEATRIRPQRKVRVVNLGLEAEEGLDMGLQVETLKKKQPKNCADYVSVRWQKWYKSNRIELNAMDTPTFIKWLDKKMEDYANGKLIPPDHILSNEFESKGEQKIKDKVRDKLIREAKIEERTEEILKQIFPKFKEKLRLEELKATVKKKLSDNPYLQWKKPISDVVDEILAGLLTEYDV